ncbi:unnamed protein product [Plutella xylostella]|uniref:(diamondback moth) hypothetical protein n=1 Tax=Plutella xylostella TaxID=51655 RepID=A0A8S4G6B1_PLUXY|nr:unnamed protein product [Plutella xylostella]
MLGVWLACAVLVVSAEGGLAPFIIPCHQADSECLKSSTQKAVPVLAGGVPALGLPPLDPMVVERVKASQAGLIMDFRNTTVKGLRNCAVEHARRQTHKLNLEIKCSVTLNGDYKLAGKLLILPIEGEGKYKIRIRDIVVKILLNMDTVDSRGAKHWKITDWKHSSDVKTGAEFQFQNLFNGNKQLSDSIHQFANGNWKDITHEVAPPIVKAIVTRIVDDTQKFFMAVPANQLALD